MILPFFPTFRNVIATLGVLTLLGVGATGRPVRAADNAADAPARPVLRVETGMHTARITTLSASGDLLVTGSLDKTVRVWRREPGGDLTALGVLRPPLRSGEYDGMIFAAAISPDRRTVACGGWTGKDGSGFSVYLFDRASGVMRRRIAGLPEIVTALAFSPDGAKIAVGVGGGRGGLHVFALADGKEIATDDYKLPCNSVDFAADGRLVAAVGSPVLGGGFVRLYDAAKNKTVVTQNSDKSATPQTARFSPDGAKIAVGYARPLRVDVCDAANLSSSHTVLPMGASSASGALPFVCWSSDGDTLAAAGTLRSGERFVVRRWSHVLAGSPAPEDTPVADDLVGALAASPDGSILFAAADPTIGSVAPDGTAHVGAACPIAREGGRGSDLRLSRNGATVGFSFQPFGHEPAFFRIGDPEIVQGATGNAAVNASRPVVGDPRLTGWTPGGEGAQSPKLNGKPLALQQGETLATVAPGADGNLVLGTNFHLVAYGANGKERWRIVAPAETRIACVAPSGTVVAAAFADGTIRWYRMRDGAELLDFFAHTDRRRWVLWTPSGYYGCSTGGEDLIGWHLNRGADQSADFFPASRFHQLSYRPDVIQLVLDTLDETAARRLADQAIEQQRARALSAVVLSRPAAAPEPIDLTQLYPSGTVAPPAPHQGPAVGSATGPATLSQSNNGATVIGSSGIEVNTTGKTASGAVVLQSPSGQPGKAIPGVPKTGPTPLTTPAPLTGPDVVPVASGSGQSPLAPSHSAPTTTAAPAATLPQGTGGTPSGSAVMVTDPTQRAVPNVSSSTSTHALPVVREEPIAIEQALPPVVRILSPRDDTSLKGDATIVRIAVRTPANAPITDVKVLIDGRPATLARGLNFSGADEGGGAASGLTGRDEAQSTTADEQTRDLPVVLPNHNCEISVVVLNRNAASVPAIIRILRQQQAAAPVTGKLYVLAVGVSKYANLPSNMRLEYPAIDARAFAAAVQKQKGSMYQDVQVKVLTDEQATRAEIDNGLEWLQKNTTSSDAAMVFFSGHGANNEANPKKPVYNFLPYNFDLTQWKSTGVPSSDIEDTLSAIQGRVMLFLDTCDSGNVDISSVVNSLSSAEHGVAVFCASGRSQQALENSAWGNGAFTKAVIEAMTATPDTSIPLSDGPEARMELIRKLKAVTFEDLQGYVHDRVQELTGQKQEPVCSFPSLGGSRMIAHIPGS